MSKVLSILAWFVISITVLVIVTIPVSLQTHLVMAAVLLGGMMVIKLLRLDGNWRLLLLTFGTVIVLRYAFWRTTSTLPPLEQWGDFIPGFTLYLCEMYCILMLFLSLFVVIRPMPRHVSTRLPKDEPVPTVDVFIPTYNEDYELLAGTLAAARSLDYPEDRFTVWLLDDGSTDAKRNDADPDKASEAQERHEKLQRLCEELGCRYLTRALNEHAKAGNLNNGLAHSSGEYVAVFDADHAPARDFLQETVPF